MGNMLPTTFVLVTGVNIAVSDGLSDPAYDSWIRIDNHDSGAVPSANKVVTERSLPIK